VPVVTAAEVKTLYTTITTFVYLNIYCWCWNNEYYFNVQV